MHTLVRKQQGRRGGRSHEQRFEEVIKTLHQLPAEDFAGDEQLMALSAHDLKVEVAGLGDNLLCLLMSMLFSATNGQQMC